MLSNNQVLVIIILSTINLGYIHGNKIKSLDFMRWNIFSIYQAEGLKALIKTIEQTHYLEASIQEKISGGLAASYYVSEEAINNEQWIYFVENYLQKEIQKEPDFEVTDQGVNLQNTGLSWAAEYGNSLILAYIEQMTQIEPEKEQLKRNCSVNSKCYFDIFKMLYLHSYGLLKEMGKIPKTQRTKSVLLLLRVEGRYQSIKAVSSAKNHEFQISQHEVYSEAETLAKYLMESSDDNNILRYYCFLLSARNYSDDRQLCSEVEYTNDLVINRTYYSIAFEPDLWYMCCKKQADRVDYLEVMKCYFAIVSHKQEHNDYYKTFAPFLRGILSWLQNLSDNRFVEPQYLVEYSIIRKIFKDPFLRYEKTIIFDSSYRQAYESNLLGPTVHLYGQDIKVENVFKLIVVDSSVIGSLFLKVVKNMTKSRSLIIKFINYIEAMQGQVVPGFNLFFIESSGLENIDQWNFIKDNFMGAVNPETGIAHRINIENNIMLEAFEYYKELNPRLKNISPTSFSNKRGIFINDLFLKSYIYAQEIMYNGGRTKNMNLVKFTFKAIPNRIIIRTKSRDKEFFIDCDYMWEQIEKSSDAPLAEKIRLYVRAYYLTDLPKWFLDFYKLSSWIETNLLLEYEYHDIILENAYFHNLLKLNSNSNNEKILSSMLKLLLKMLLSKTNKDPNDEFKKIKTSNPSWSSIIIKLSQLFHDSFNEEILDINQMISSQKLLKLKIEVPDWFRENLNNNKIKFSSPTPSALFFRTFSIVKNKST